MANIFDKENQMILRVPDEIADRLNDLFEEEGADEQFIDITPCIVKNPKTGNVAQFKFKFENFEAPASLVDLPCIIESHKSVDSINMFKSNDISQMIYVHPQGEKFLEDCPNHQKTAKKIDQASASPTASQTPGSNPSRVVYLARDGLTVPTKSIRTRFFRKDFDVPINKIREIEEEMSQILDEIKKNKRDGDGASQRSSEENNLTVQLGTMDGISMSGSKR